MPSFYPGLDTFDGQCGWLKDKFGLSWQINPTVLLKCSVIPIQKSQRVVEAMLQMKKIGIAGLQKAYDQR